MSDFLADQYHKTLSSDASTALISKGRVFVTFLFRDLRDFSSHHAKVARMRCRLDRPGGN
jgi:hypothetical protein